MASFDMATVGKAIESFEANFKDLQDFLNKVEIMNTTIKYQDHEFFIKYFYNFKLKQFL